MKLYLALMEKYISASQRNFIIVEPDPLIGLDLTGILQSEFPDAELTLFHSQEEAGAYIFAAPQPLCVLLNTNAASEAMLTLLRDHVAPRGDVLFIGSERDVGFPASFVQTPFTSRMILSSLVKRTA